MKHTLYILALYFCLFCPNGKVNPGDHKHQVLERCGRPDKVYTDGLDTSNRSERRFEDWVYEDLKGCMTRILTFTGNRVTGLEEYRQ